MITFQGTARMESLPTLITLVWLVDVFVEKQMVVEIAGAFQRCAANVAHGFGIGVSSPVRVKRFLMLQRFTTNVAHKRLVATVGRHLSIFFWHFTRFTDTQKSIF